MIISRSILGTCRFRKIKLCEDYLFKCELLKKDNIAKKLNENLASYRIAKDSRSSKLSDSFVGKIKLEYGFKEYLKERNDFYKKVDDSYFQGKWQASLCKELGNTLFTLDSKNYGQQEFAAYIERKSRKKRKEPIINPLYIHVYRYICNLNWTYTI